MKVGLNLAMAPDARERYALAWAIPMTLGALAVLAYLAMGVTRDLRNYREYHGSVLKTQVQEARWRQTQKALREELERPQYQRAFRLTKFVNTLIEEKVFSLAHLMEKVAKVLPPQVRLDGLAYSPQSHDQVVRFTVVAKNQDAMETFISNLEDSKDFENISVVSGGLGGKGGGEASLTCTAVYRSGAGR